MELFTQTTILGLSNAAVYMLIAVGVSLVFGVLGVMNFAHGEFTTIGAYMAVISATAISGNFLVGLVLGILASGLLGLVSYVTVIGPMRSRPELMTLLATFGLALACQAFVYAVWGGDSRSLPRNTDSFSLFGATVPLTSAANVVAAAVVIGVLLVIVSRSSFGRNMRAVAQNRREAELAGINPRTVEMMAVALSATVAGIAGVMLAQRVGITPFTGFELVLKAFAIAIVAGLGRIQGVIVVALILGMAEAMVSTYIDGSLSTAVVFATLLITLMIRPAGLFTMRLRA